MSTISQTQPHVLTAPTAVRLEGLRGLRYGEVLVVRENNGAYSAEIWNSMGLGDCPQAAWVALDPVEITRESQALITLLNGPRHWLMDAIENVPPVDRQFRRFGTIDTSLVATLDLGTELPDPTPYTERTVLRDTIWEWSPGRTIYELVTPQGVTYVMQAYCLAVDSGLTEDVLGELASRLTVPEGWHFRTRVIDETLHLRAPDAVATVIQDELKNTYMRNDG